jgi:ankyrin repeat protein
VRFFLIENGINVNALDSNGDSPMYLAISKSNRTVTKALINTNKLNLNQLKNNGTLLQDAILQGEKNIIEMLLKTNIDKNHLNNQERNILFDAIGNGNEKIIELILKLDDLNFNVVDINGKTILHQNSVLKNDSLAIKLIKSDVDPTILDKNGKSYLLHAALRGGNVDPIIDATLEAGFNINSFVRNRNSILMENMFLFAKLSKSEIKRRDKLMATASNLVKKGLDVNAINTQGETVLFKAAKRLDIQTCAFLLKENTSVNVVNNKGDTVLSEIIYYGIEALDIVCLLLRNKADLNHKNKYRQTIVEIVNKLVLYSHGNIQNTFYDDKKINKNLQYMRLLKNMLEMSDFNVNIITSKGELLFFKSLLFGNRPLFELYCNYGVDIINALLMFEEIIFLLDILGKWLQKMYYQKIIEI